MSAFRVQVTARHERRYDQATNVRPGTGVATRAYESAVAQFVGLTPDLPEGKINSLPRGAALLIDSMEPVPLCVARHNQQAAMRQWNFVGPKFFNSVFKKQLTSFTQAN